MNINIKKQSAIFLILSSIGWLYPLLAMENNEDLDYKNELNINSSDLFNNIILIQDVKTQILLNTFFEESISNGNPVNLLLVCKDWNHTLKNNFKSIDEAWKSHYNFSGIEYQLIKTMKIQYRPNPDSDMDMITLKIPTFANPFGHKFNLSGCGDAGKYLCISMGYRAGMNPENKDKVEIFVAPRKMIKKDLATTAAHYTDIIAKWGDDAPVGIFFSWGNWEHNECYKYLTHLSPVGISTKNYLELCFLSTSFLNAYYILHALTPIIPSKHFTFHFEPKQELKDSEHP